ncbi:MAG: TPP-binding protein [Betaproteobacteria bacterium]|nr:MAG: TPP-binding protein [Betaproteobacteria bacterium]
MQIMTTGQATVETLLRHGIDTVYAVPGVHNDHLFDALYHASNRIRVIHARHEQAAGYMAMGAALATGRPQILSVVPGPGLLNASAALLTAHATGAPVVALVGQIRQAHIDRGYGNLHELHDQLGVLRRVTKFCARINSPSEAPELVARAIHQACSGRTRPTALECAIDVWGQKGPVVIADPVPPSFPPVDEEAVAAAASLLSFSKRPLIVVGSGAQDAAAEVRALAERLEAPVVSFRRGQGVLAGNHRLSVPVPIGHRLWREADVVLGIGTRVFMQQESWGVDRDMAILRIDVDPEEPDRFRKADRAMIGDAAATLRVLLDKLPPEPRASRADELAAHRAWLAQRLKGLEPQLGFLRAMRAALPEDGILVDEVTQVGFASRVAFPVSRPRSFISTYQDNLGYGYGTALGVKAACPDRAVLSIAGDGGFAYQAMELATAVLHRLAVVVLVFDDGKFGNVQRIQATQFGNRLIACDLANPDFVRFAESFGVAAFRAHTPADLEIALRQAFALGAPALVHVPVGEMPSVWDLIRLPRVRG